MNVPRFYVVGYRQIDGDKMNIFIKLKKAEDFFDLCIKNNCIYVALLEYYKKDEYITLKTYERAKA